MDQYTDERIEEILTKTGEALAPRRESLRAVLGVPAPAVRPQSALLVVSSYMSTYSKLGVAALAIVIIAGGALYASSPKGGDVAMQPSMMAKDTALTSQTAVMAEASLPQATASVDDFAAAIEADLVSQKTAVAAVDTQVNASAASVSSVTNTNTLYDPNNI